MFTIVLRNSITGSVSSVMAAFFVRHTSAQCQGKKPSFKMWNKNDITFCVRKTLYLFDTFPLLILSRFCERWSSGIGWLSEVSCGSMITLLERLLTIQRCVHESKAVAVCLALKVGGCQWLGDFSEACSQGWVSIYLLTEFKITSAH